MVLKQTSDSGNFNRSDGNIFLSSIWLNAWQEIISQADTHDVQIAVSGNGYYLVRKGNPSFFSFARPTLHLNEYPEKPLNFAMEYNGISKNGGDSWQALLEKLARNDVQWSTLNFRNLTKANFLECQQICKSLSLNFETSNIIKAPFVDFQTCCDSAALTSSCLSKNTRGQLSKTRSFYEKKYGPISVKVTNAANDKKTWDQLSLLHTEYWHSKGRSGSFKNEYWLNFHQRMWQDTNARFEPVLVSISAGTHCLGVIYCLIYDNVVNQIQSGFDYSNKSNSARPGYLGHWLAIQHFHMNEKLAYKFLAGNDRYKQSLANNADELYSLRIYSNRALYCTNLLARSFLGRLESVRKATVRSKNTIVIASRLNGRSRRCPVRSQRWIERFSCSP